MANLYSVPLKNSVQHTLAGTLTIAETGTITLDSSVALELQATATMKGLLVVDRVDVNGTLTPSKTEFISYTGVTGSTVTGLTRAVAGTTAQGHSIGAIVEFVPDVTWAQAINDVLTTQHNSDGTHSIVTYTAMKQNLVTSTDGATITFNLNASNIFSVTLGATGRTLAVSNATVGQCFIIRLVQGGSGSNLVTFFSTIKWSAGVTPVLTTTLNKTDVFGFICTSAGNFDGFIVGQNL